MVQRANRVPRVRKVQQVHLAQQEQLAVQDLRVRLGHRASKGLVEQLGAQDLKEKRGRAERLENLGLMALMQIYGQRQRTQQHRITRLLSPILQVALERHVLAILYCDRITDTQ